MSREPAETEASEAAPGESATAPGTDASGEPVMTHWAQRETRISATWRIYDAGADAVLDEQRDRVMGSRSRVEGASLEAALANLATAESMISRDGRKLGMEYARRISPVYVTLERSYFGGGMTFGRPPGSLKEGRIYVKAGDWDGAAEIFKSIVDDPASSMKQRGKARHNLAIAAEIKGQLRKAHKLAQKAAVENNTGRSRAYARSLERRVADQARLEAQLAPPEDDE